MKRKSLTLSALALAAALLLAGCGAAADTAAPADTGADTAAADTSDVGGTEAADTGDTAPDADAAPAPNVQAADNQIAYNGVLVAPGMDVAHILEALGDGYEYSENISCMFEDGMDKTYTYPDLTIYAYPVSADQDMILMVEVTTDQVETARGVKLGDSLDSALLLCSDLLQADSSGMRYTADIDGVLLTITALDGAVDTITYELSETPTV